MFTRLQLNAKMENNSLSLDKCCLHCQWMNQGSNPFIGMQPAVCPHGSHPSTCCQLTFIPSWSLMQGGQFTPATPSSQDEQYTRMTANLTLTQRQAACPHPPATGCGLFVTNDRAFFISAVRRQLRLK